MKRIRIKANIVEGEHIAKPNSRSLKGKRPQINSANLLHQKAKISKRLKEHAGSVESLDIRLKIVVTERTRILPASIKQT